MGLQMDPKRYGVMLCFSGHASPWRWDKDARGRYRLLYVI